MAEKQSLHRQNLESKVVGSNIINERIGMVFGLVVCLSAIGAGTYLLLQGKEVYGISAIISALASPLAVFIYGKRKQTQNLQARQHGIIEAAKQTRNR
jgi:hypothetical protein